MIAADLINGSFELLAGIAILFHCRAIWRDREVKGISIPSVIFFTLWGYWNLYYYPSLGQFWSFLGGVAVVAANTLWVGLLIWYAVILPRRKVRAWFVEGGILKDLESREVLPGTEERYGPFRSEQEANDEWRARMSAKIDICNHRLFVTKQFA